MSTEEPSPRSVPIGAIVVLVFAVFIYIGMVACLSDLHGSDAAGRGLTAAFAILFGFVLWILLSILLILGAINGAMPFWAAISAAILLPLSAIAAAIALDLQEQRITWLLIVPIGLPPVIAAYAMWARVTALHRLLPPTGTSAALLGAMLVLVLAPMPQFIAREAEYAALVAQERAEEKAEKAEADKRHAEALARFRKLTAESPLSEWAAFFGNDSEFDTEAAAGARKLPHRQADAEEALRRGIGFPLAEYYRLDLAVTPAFCTAARDFLAQGAATHQARAGDADDRTAQDYFDPYLGAIESLTQENCDIDDAVKAIEAALSPAPPAASRGFLGILAWRRGNGFIKRGDNDRAIEQYDAAIRFSPDNEQFVENRGNVYFDKGEYSRAIADFTEAIRLNPGYSTAFEARGVAYHEAGDDDHAMQDHDEAIRLNPEFALAYDYRGLLYSARGDQARAIEDYDAAVRLAPRFSTALANRGRARFYQAAYPQAVIDLAAAVALSPKEPYAVLWLYLAHARAGQPARESLTADSSQLDRTAWPWPIVAAYLGEADPGAVLASTRTGNDPTHKGQECEVEFYLGAKAASENDATAARELLQRAVTGCPANFIETPAAKFELARLSP